MEETMITGTEEDQSGSAFLEGLENSDGAETVDQPMEEAEETLWAEEPESAEGEAGAEEPGDSPETQADTRQGAEGEEAGQEKEGKEEQRPPEKTAWSVKHMGAERTITAAEVTPELLQKGLDYDRVRGKYNEAKPLLEVFGRLAQQAGMNVAEYVTHIRTETMRSKGMSPTEARQAVEREDREAVARLQENYRRERAAVIAKSQERLRTDVAEFSKAFPEIYERAKHEPHMIPQKVWKAVNGGMSLTAAYSRYAIDMVNGQLQAARDGARVTGENHRNALRSTGSMRSAGNDRKNSDPFLEGFGG